MKEELSFSEEAELNRYLFYKDLNDINFFVEDKDKEYEYETILNRLFGNTYSIKAIIPAGGKIGVKNAYEEFGEFNNEDSKRINIYVVDGDFDKYIRPNDMIINLHFIYLQYYNIENYFIDEKAILLFAKSKIKKIDKEVKEKVKYEYWRQRIVNQAGRLFLLYCAVQSRVPFEKNVARNEYLFIDGKTGFERENAYQDYCDFIIQKDPDILSEVEIIKSKYEEINGEDYFGLICGKFLLTSLYTYLRGVCKVKFSKDDLRWALINEFDISSLFFIKERIEKIFASEVFI